MKDSSRTFDLIVALILGRLISMTTGVKYLPRDFILIYPPKQKLGGYKKGTERYFDISYIITKYAHNLYELSILNSLISFVSTYI